MFFAVKYEDFILKERENTIVCSFFSFFKLLFASASIILEVNNTLCEIFKKISF